MLLVSNLQRSVDFYVRVLGMKLFTKVASIDGQLRMAQLGYGDRSKGRTFIELREKHGLIQRGHGYVLPGIPCSVFCRNSNIIGISVLCYPASP